MIKQKSLVTLSAFVMSAFFMLVTRNFVHASSNNKITICHATDSQSNPYVTNQPNKSGDVSGHNGHNGPVWYSGISGKWGDIIPPFYYDDGEEYYPGKNWNATGQAIYNNGCNKVNPTATPTPTIVLPTAYPTPTVVLPTIPVACEVNCVVPTIVIPTIIIPSVITPTLPQGNVEEGNIYDPCVLNRCPSATPTATPTATLTPTSTPAPTSSQGGTGGNSDSGSSSSSSSSSSASNNGSVQGATTTLAATGVFEDMFMNMVGLAGVALSGLSAVMYAKKS